MVPGRDHERILAESVREVLAVNTAEKACPCWNSADPRLLDRHQRRGHRTTHRVRVERDVASSPTVYRGGASLRRFTPLGRQSVNPANLARDANFPACV